MLGKRTIFLFIALFVLSLGCAKKEAEIEIVEEIEEKEVIEPEEEIPPVVPEEEVASRMEMIHFDFDKYNVRTGDAEILKKNSEALKEYPDVAIVIEGHCDERGTNEYNLALGERRAKAAKDYLVQLEIKEERLSTVSYGEEQALDSGHNEEAWSKNRRAEFKVK